MKGMKGKGKKHNTKKQPEHRLDIQTAEALEQSGANNHLQAQFYNDVAKVALNSTDPVLYFVKPNVNVPQKEEWKRSLIFVIRLLKKYNMHMTLECIKTEAPKLTKMFNYRATTENTVLFEELLGISEDLGDKSFEERVDEFFTENGIEIE